MYTGVNAPSAARRNGRPTMKDVADQVGVSIKSVSRVLNGESGVSAGTAQRIMDTAAAMGFRRNDLASSLRRGQRTGVVGLILKHSSTQFYENLIRGIDGVAEQYGSLVLTAGSRTADQERETLLALSARRLDGMLVVPTGQDHSYLVQEQSMGMPMVFVDRPPHGLEADAILADDFGGGRSAAEYLLHRGHRRFGVIGASAQVHTVAERVRGFRSVLQEHGADDVTVLLERETERSAQDAARELLDVAEQPSAIFTLNNVCTAGALRALRAASAEDRVSLVGFDDFPLADLIHPAVTVITHDIAEMGRLAAERLFARINGEGRPAETTILPTRLIER